MQYKFSSRVQNVPNSGIGFMMRYASKYKDVISLGQGTPQFPTPQFIYDYLYERAKTDKKVGMYSDPGIEAELKQLIAKQIKNNHEFTPSPDELYLTLGGIGGLYAACMSFLEKGDQAIYFDPSYPLHLAQIHLTQAKPIFVPFKEDQKWAIDLDKLENSITRKTKIVVLTNPNNPTGTVLSEKEVKQLAKIIIDHNLILLLDEAYEFLTYDTELYSPLNIAKLRNNLIVCRSFSKEFAMTGWRLGYLYANPEIISKLREVHLHFCISPPTPAIVACIGALSDKRGEEAKQHFKSKFTESRGTICERFDRLPKLFSYQKPAGAYYVFPKITGLKLSSLEFAKLLVDEAKVITIPGSTMGPSGEHHLRMSFAADPTVINQAFDRIDDFAKRHDLL
ncbi:MAG: pyridoxal phosphate-dependent aminotransferase [Candidatus Woesearchaeota archaeon]